MKREPRARLTCYMCDSRPTSKEHVPPKCFFPRPSELSNASNFTKNLITVPSCDLHNLEKSEDDQYLLAVVVSQFGGNRNLKLGPWSRVLRSIQKRPRLREVYFKHLQPVQVGRVQTGGFNLDLSRFNAGMSQMARAVFFHHHNERWAATESNILCPNLVMVGRKQVEYNSQMAELSSSLEDFFRVRPKHGGNPGYFYYQIDYSSTAVQLVIRMAFYQNVTVYMLSAPLLAW